MNTGKQLLGQLSKFKKYGFLFLQRTRFFKLRIIDEKKKIRFREIRGEFTMCSSRKNWYLPHVRFFVWTLPTPRNFLFSFTLTLINFGCWDPGALSLEISSDLPWGGWLREGKQLLVLVISYQVLVIEKSRVQEIVFHCTYILINN